VSRVVLHGWTNRWTDRIKLVFALRNFAKASKNNKYHISTLRVEECSFLVSKLAIQTAASRMSKVIIDQFKKIIMIPK